MIDVMSLLLGGTRHAPGRQVFRSLVSEEARVRVMRSLLEHSRLNHDKTQEFDDVIDLFVQVKTRRNALAHGLWQTHQDGSVWIQEPSPDETAEFHSAREVKIGELDDLLKQMSDLFGKCLAIAYPEVFSESAKKRSASRRKPPTPPDVTGW
jgi:hypothetical protein